MLGGLGKSYDPFLQTLDSMKEAIPLDELIGKLLSMDNRRNGEPEARGEQSALAIKRDSGRGNSANQPSKEEPVVITCFKCQALGHKANVCPQKKKSPQKKNGKEKPGSGKALFTVFSPNEKSDQEKWYVDSCASQHMSPDKNLFSDFSDKKSGISFTVANKEKIFSAGSGNVSVKVKDSEEIKSISDVLYVPDASANLLSVGAAVEKGLSVVFSKSDGCQFFDIHPFRKMTLRQRDMLWLLLKKQMVSMN